MVAVLGAHGSSLHDKLSDTNGLSLQVQMELDT